MKRRVLMGCLALALVGCAQSTEVGDPDTPLGSLTLALKGTDSSGVSYWLRNANFQITGWPDYYPQPRPGVGGAGGYPGPMGEYYEQVSTEDDPDATEIRRRLVPGQYNVVLVNEDWYLERGEGDTRERVGKVVLLTPSYQYAYVWDGGSTYIGFRFGVDGELIDFRSGELTIGVEIEKPGERCTFGYAGYGGWGGPGNCGTAGWGMGAAGGFAP